MSNKEEVKNILTPTVVVQHYLGQPVKSDRLGMWYKSPFRNERTASFLVSDVKGIHDFGTSEHYDVISFVEKLFKIDFKTSLNKLLYDFGIIDSGPSSQELKAYLIKQREEEIKIKKNLDSWFNETYIKICEELNILKKCIPYLKQDALVEAYSKDVYLECLVESFINANEDNKYQLWKAKYEIEKYI